MNNLMINAIDAMGMGFVYFPLALGVFLSYRMLRFPDITVDGAFSLGAAVTVTSLIAGIGAFPATALGMLAGGGAGILTALLITRFRIEKVLAGILVSIALYSAYVMILGSVEYMLNEEASLWDYAKTGAIPIFGSSGEFYFLGIRLFARPLLWVLCSGAGAIVLLTGLIYFFRTRFGLAMRAAGENPSAARAVGAHVSWMVFATLILSNALAALSGSLYAQVSSRASIEDGIGAIVTGLACVLIGDVFVVKRRFMVRLSGVLLGAILYQFIMKLIVVYFGDSGNALKLIAALVVVIVLVVPQVLSKLIKKTGEEVVS